MSSVITCASLSFAWPDGARRCSASTWPSAPAAPGWSGQRRRQVDPAAPDRRANSRPPRARSRSPARSATCPRASRSTSPAGRRAARHHRATARAAGDRGRATSTEAHFDGGRRRLGRRGARRRRLARLGLPDDVSTGGRRAVRRRGRRCSAWPGCCCAARTCCCSTSRRTTSTGTPASGCTTPSTPGRARSSWSATTGTLLERVDRIGELRDGAMRWYGGNCPRTDAVGGRAGGRRAGGAGRRGRRAPPEARNGSRPSGQLAPAGGTGRRCATASANPRS